MIRYISAEAFDSFYCKITCEEESFWPWIKPKIVHYVGNGTVWHRYPDGKRASTHLEMWLSERWTKWRWESKV